MTTSTRAYSVLTNEHTGGTHCSRTTIEVNEQVLHTTSNDDDNDDDDDEEGPYPYAVQDNISVQSCHRAASVGDTMLRIKYRKSIRIRETTLQRQSDSRRRVE